MKQASNLLHLVTDTVPPYVLGLVAFVAPVAVGVVKLGQLWAAKVGG